MRRLACLLLCLPLLGCPSDDDDDAGFGSPGDDDDAADDDDTADDDDDSSADDDDSSADDDDDDDDVVAECDEDGAEPNEAQGSAVTITDDQFNLSACPGDEDWFAVFMSSGDELEVEALFDADEGHVDLAILDATGAPVDLATEEDPVARWLQSSDGLMFIRARLGGDAGEVPGVEYELDLTLIEAGCPTDLYEPNDDLLSSSPITPGNLDGLGACAETDDWYSITVEIYGGIEILGWVDELEGDIDITLWGPGDEVVAESVYEVDAETISWPADATNQYYIQVVLAEDLGSEPGALYDLLITVFEPSCPFDAFEPNDAAGSAPIGAGSYPGLAACDTDEDWFEFDLETGDLLEVTTTFAHDEGDIDLFLYNPGGTLVDSAESTDDDELLAYSAEATSPYHLLVQLTAEDGFVPGSAYDMDVAITAVPTVCTVDALEPNDAFGSGQSVSPGAYAQLQACADDEDWFVISMLAGQTLDVDLVFAHAEGNVDLALYDSGMAFLVESLSTTDNEATTWVVGADDTLWVQVVLESDAGTELGNEYELILSVTEPS